MTAAGHVAPVVGVLGLGAYGERLARSLDVPPHRLLLSERGRHSEAVSAQRGCVRLPNAELVRHSDLVFLCVRAEQAQACVEGLPWREGQVLVSTCATVPLLPLAQACRPAAAVRALPLPGGPDGAAGCSILWPGESRVRSLLSALGAVVVLPEEGIFPAACAAACLQSWSHQLAAWTAAWAEGEGLGPREARALVAACLECAGSQLRQDAATPFDDLLAAIATPGGLSEAGLRTLALHGADAAWTAALEAARARALGEHLKIHLAYTLSAN
jgi:pyrroline-5-carboxylate reductase